MTRLLLDTHAWVWAMFNDPQLSPRARAAIAASPHTAVSPISLFEIAQKVRIGKWPILAPHLSGLADRLVADGGSFATFSGEIAVKAGMLPWEHRDPFDRMIAATVIVEGYDLVSADKAFDAVVPAGLRRIW